MAMHPATMEDPAIMAVAMAPATMVAGYGPGGRRRVSARSA